MSLFHQKHDDFSINLHSQTTSANTMSFQNNQTTDANQEDWQGDKINGFDNSSVTQCTELLNFVNELNDEPEKRYCICLTTDFVAPKWGGVETHSFQLASHLIERGHKVIMITSMFQGVREGVRVLGNGMKVYHLPLLPVVHNDVSLVAKYNILPVIR